MKLKFFWTLIFDSPFPICINDSPSYENCDPLSTILSDDGGLGLEYMIAWVEVAIDTTNKVISGQMDEGDWITETFSAEIGREQTEIYYLYDDSYSQFIPTEIFLK
ncbi:hypothetical protein TUM4438_45730 [Shewanella sairae]|uniref:Uncharacterized protein n=1 Tax=Shewanella sairae TaxID=190310 RepID=A0ABQ4PRV6_9GAMM|nr:hypothetical protein [Shewanella sairae]MCL1132570.1 hypothetical protein [Shewanella sairae]GIU52607.1 hypothetical protein TUM4438_45730 [Shewanella sairae]